MPKITKAQLIEENNYLKIQINNKEKQLKELHDKYNTRLENQMLEARIKLASQIGQLVEATSKAVTMIVGKEVF